MQMNMCDVNHLDADSHLPPRKRLLAGLKRQCSDVNSPAPSTSRSPEKEYDARLSDLLRSQLSDPNLSNDEIIEASRCAAIEAAKVAAAARINAEEKAEKAAKAVAAAKSALDRVASLEESTNKEKSVKKNKMKKHVPLRALYNTNRKGNANCRTDEELARNLHRAINSSPRILKNASGSYSKNQKHKRLKTSASSGRPTNVYNAVPAGEGNRPSTATSNGKGVAGDSEGPLEEMDMIMVDPNKTKRDRVGEPRMDNGGGLRPSKTDQLNLGNGYLGALSRDKFSESSDSFGRKRGRMKQKKLPLSICSFRDQTSPKEELKTGGTPQSEDVASRTPIGNQPLLLAGTSGNSLMPVEKTSLWKCQSFKAPPCVAPNKVMHS